MQLDLFGASVSAQVQNPPTTVPETLNNEVGLDQQQTKKTFKATSDGYGVCRICGCEIAVPGLDASLCSNPKRACGTAGWVASLDCLRDETQAKKAVKRARH